MRHDLMVLEAGGRIRKNAELENRWGQKVHERTCLKCGQVKWLPLLAVGQLCRVCSSKTNLKKASRLLQKHGESGKARTKLYTVWMGMRCRCSPCGQYFKIGIRVCREWNEYLPFKRWALGNGYKQNLSIDRINPYGNYSPENCRWATALQQATEHKRHPVDWKTRRKLSAFQIRKIKRILTIKSDTEIGRMFGVTSATIHSIKIGRTYKWVKT